MQNQNRPNVPDRIVHTCDARWQKWQERAENEENFEHERLLERFGLSSHGLITPELHGEIGLLDEDGSRRTKFTALVLSALLKRATKESAERTAIAGCQIFVGRFPISEK